MKCPAETECLYCCPIPFNSRGTGVRTAHSSHSGIICRTTTTRSRDHQLSSAGLPLPGHVITNYHLQNYHCQVTWSPNSVCRTTTTRSCDHQLLSAELPLPGHAITNCHLQHRLSLPTIICSTIHYQMTNYHLQHYPLPDDQLSSAAQSTIRWPIIICSTIHYQITNYHLQHNQLPDHKLSSAELPLPGHVIISYHLQHYPLPDNQLSSAELCTTRSRDLQLSSAALSTTRWPITICSTIHYQITSYHLQHIHYQITNYHLQSSISGPESGQQSS